MVSVSKDGYHPGICPYGGPLSPVVRQAPPLLAQKGRQSQLERFPDPLPLPPELPERPVDREKGRRWLWLLFGLLAA